MRTRLQIEYLRLLDQAEVVGLIEYKNGQDLLESLKLDRFILVAMLIEIHFLIKDLVEINSKYIELRLDKDFIKKREAIELELVEQFFNILLDYEKKAKKRTYFCDLNHIIRSSVIIKDMIRYLKRLKQIAFDRNVFKKLLKRLTKLNDYLYEIIYRY